MQVARARPAAVPAMRGRAYCSRLVTMRSSRVDLVEDDLHEARAFVARLEAPQQHLRAGADPRQRIADLVRHAGRQAARAWRGARGGAAPAACAASRVRSRSRHQHPRRPAEAVACAAAPAPRRRRAAQHGLALEVRARRSASRSRILARRPRVRSSADGPAPRARAGETPSSFNAAGLAAATRRARVDQQHPGLGVIHERAEHRPRSGSGCAPRRSSWHRHRVSAIRRSIAPGGARLKAASRPAC